MMGGIIGIGIGIVLIVGVQIFCYKFFDEDNYRLAIVVGLSCLILGILTALIVVKIGG